MMKTKPKTLFTEDELEQLKIIANSDITIKVNGIENKLAVVDCKDNLTTAGYNPWSDIDSIKVQKLVQDAGIKSDLKEIEHWLKVKVFENGKYTNMSVSSIINIAKIAYLFGKSGQNIKYLTNRW